MTNQFYGSWASAGCLFDFHLRLIPIVLWTQLLNPTCFWTTSGRFGIGLLSGCFFCNPSCFLQIIFFFLHIFVGTLKTVIICFTSQWDMEEKFLPPLILWPLFAGHWKGTNTNKSSICSHYGCKLSSCMLMYEKISVFLFPSALCSAFPFRGW